MSVPGRAVGGREPAVAGEQGAQAVGDGVRRVDERVGGAGERGEGGRRCGGGEEVRHRATVPGCGTARAGANTRRAVRMARTSIRFGEAGRAQPPEELRPSRTPPGGTTMVPSPGDHGQRRFRATAMRCHAGPLRPWSRPGSPPARRRARSRFANGRCRGGRRGRAALPPPPSPRASAWRTRSRCECGAGGAAFGRRAPRWRARPDELALREREGLRGVRLIHGLCLVGELDPRIGIRRRGLDPSGGETRG